MKRPYLVCHMVTSIDGRVTGDFLSHAACEAATEIYYEINRAYRQRGARGFICGRITMEQSFTGGWYPSLATYAPAAPSATPHFWPKEAAGREFYAIAFDPKGRLGWRSAVIEDSDPGYDGAAVVEVLTEQADPRYLAYLQERGIPYLIAGREEIDVDLALRLLREYSGAELLLLEGGSIVNRYFLRADCVDEISAVQAPITADPTAKPLFGEGTVTAFTLAEVQQKEGALVARYTRTAPAEEAER